jgi:enoyl-CoA hydratase/carnithine racemase
MTKQDNDTEPYVLEGMSGHVLWLTLNRPRPRNPLSSGMIAALKIAIDAANGNSEVRVVVLTGSGPVFSAGHDLRELIPLPGEASKEREARVRQILMDCAEMMLGIVHSPKAIVACVQATATAAGCQLVSACDMAIASDEAKFCLPGVNIGSFCTTPLVGVGRNIHRKHAMELAQKIASKSVQGICSGKEAFYRQIDMPIEEAFRFANEVMLCGLTKDDAAEGTNAFLEKRAAVWGDV